MQEENDYLLLPVWMANDIGIYETIILHRMDQWMIEKEKFSFIKEFKGFYWVGNIFPEMREAYKFLRNEHIRRALKMLETRRLVLSDFFKSNEGDEDKWYRINYTNVERLREIQNNP